MSHSIRWTVEKITQRLALIEPLVYRHKAELPPFSYQEVPAALKQPGCPPGNEKESLLRIPAGTYWGRPFIDFILRTTFQIPNDWEPAQPAALYLPLGDANSFSLPEALVYVDGRAYATCDRHHQEILLRPAWANGCLHELVLHGWTGLGDNWNSGKLTRLVMQTCCVVQIDQAARNFSVLARVSLGAAQTLDANAPARAALLNALDAAFKLLDTHEPFGEAFYASLPAAYAALAEGIRRAGAPLEASFTASGHAHIDVAWLWTLDQTRRKAARTFYTVMRLMEQFPEYHFTQSQPQLYEFIRQDHPELFEAVRARVSEGRWEPIGGMWVEADCNLSGAEALARQFLLGRTYFRQHFGAQAESPVLWLPDVFGYAWALPQLIKQAGLDYFFTIKLGWNQYNRLPYDSFWWQGLDGTRVLTHFSTTPENSATTIGTYNAPATPASALDAWKNFQQKEAQNEVFMAFGYGDGGGGPSREMLENLRAMAHFPGLPQARQRSAGEFFRDLEANCGPNLPVWNGELYLEYHRGTYTSQGRNKRANRKSEFALHDAEFLACLAGWLDPTYEYPHGVFQQAWQLVCLNQFHDIIPGSSIGEVYQESQAQYAEVQRMVCAVRAQALAAIAGALGSEVLLVNPTSFGQAGPVLVPGPSTGSLARGGQPLPTQPVTGGLLVDAGPLPPYSITLLERTSGCTMPSSGSPGAICLENEHLRVEFSAAGDMSRIYDKANRREVLPAGETANQLQAFEDRPKNWDAWDIDIYYDDRMWLAQPASMRWVESGPLRWTVEITRRILNSTCTQRISLVHNSPRLDFDTTLDWHERHILLKAAFPVDILSPLATYEIQWGNVQRPTHRNTSWDWARFETCAHKWVDLSEGGYGVSLLNDCKYGHDIHDNVLRLSLLRSPTVPDSEADQGEHRFIYSLLPHAGGWETSTAAEAYALNDPAIAFQAAPAQAGRQPAAAPGPFVCVSSPHVIIETVKRAEDGIGYIVRLYESQRRRGEVTLFTAFTLTSAHQCNLLEENQSALPHQPNQVSFAVRPYEIVTLRLVEKTG